MLACSQFIVSIKTMSRSHCLVLCCIYANISWAFLCVCVCVCNVPGLVKVGSRYIRGCLLLLSLQGAVGNFTASFAQAVRTVEQKENCDLKNHIFPFSR